VIQGFRIAPSMLVSTKAPRAPPTQPPIARGANSFQFTFRCQAWEPAEAAVVKTSAAWTVAEAVAGGTPTLSRTVEDTTP
jgi:hypothetical protein